MTWTEIIPLSNVRVARERLERWRARLEPREVDDDDVRLDLMRTDDGDRLRVLVRTEALPPR